MTIMCCSRWIKIFENASLQEILISRKLRQWIACWCGRIDQVLRDRSQINSYTVVITMESCIGNFIAKACTLNSQKMSTNTFSILLNFSCLESKLNFVLQEPYNNFVPRFFTTWAIITWDTSNRISNPDDRSDSRFIITTLKYWMLLDR